MDDHAPFLERAFSTEPRDQSYVVEAVEGAVPAFLRGTYYMNGPARFARGAFRYRHWLDGDGMVCALRFDRESVRFTGRLVRSTRLVTEEAAGRPVYRAFGTRFDSDRLREGVVLESPVNVSVYPYNGTLLALGEQGLPWELDPDTLETRGECDLGGVLTALTPFSAHPKFDGPGGEMCNFGITFAANQPRLHLYRFDRGGGLLSRRRLPLEYATPVHDFALSPTYAIFHVSPYIMDVEALLRDGRTVMESLSWQPARGSHLLLVSRERGTVAASIPVGARYCLHLVNAFEEDGAVTVDVIEYDRPLYDQYQVLPDLFTTVSEGRPVRFVLDAGASAVVARHEIDYRLAPDFPAMDRRRVGRPYRDGWMLGISAAGKPGRKFMDQLVHVDWADGKLRGVYQAPPGHYLGCEPVFVGDPGDESSGVLICQLFDAVHARSAFAVFDAFDVGRGPVATLRLREPIHIGFHATFDAARREAAPS